MKMMEILSGKNIIVGGLLVILLLLVGNIVIFWYVGQLIAPSLLPNRLNLPSLKEALTPVTLALDPSEGQFSTDREFPVAIVFKTAEKPVIGVDVILNYDPEKLVILKITPGEVFDFYPQLEIKENKILISAINQNQKTFAGQTILAQLRIKGKKAGVAKLSFDFMADSTTDSNVVLKEGLTDALEQVKNGVYTFE